MNKATLKFFRLSSGVTGQDMAGNVPSKADTTGVGSMLRTRRERLGHDLRGVAATLRIRHAHLAAIEDGRFADLPGVIYANGFLRSYAEFLGLDGSEVVSTFKDEITRTAPRPDFSMPTVTTEGTAPGGAVLMLALVLTGAVYGGWYYLSASDRDMVEMVPPVPRTISDSVSGRSMTTALPPASEQGGMSSPENLTNASPVTVAPAAASTAPISSTPGGPDETSKAVAVKSVSPPSDLTVAPKSEVPKSVEVQETPSANIVDKEIPAGETPIVSEPHAEALIEEWPASISMPSLDAEFAEVPTPDGAGEGGSRIALRATQESWVQLRDGKGGLVATRVLRPGDTYLLPDRPGLRLMTGNAGGLTVVVDGREGSAMGRTGQVLRDVALDDQFGMKAALTR